MLACMLNLGLDLRALGEDQEADELTANAIDGMRRVHGPQHPATMAAREDSARTATSTRFRSESNPERATGSAAALRSHAL